MALVSPAQSHLSPTTEPKVDIVGVPAIGADPRATWTCTRGGVSYNWLGAALNDELPSANVVLYDHLKPGERGLELKHTDDPTHKSSAETYALAEAAVAEYGVDEWAERFLDVLQQYRSSRRTEQRPILFLCHSTGGIVVKRALSKKVMEGKASIADVCIGITFFATPHHGSSVLSLPEYVRTVQRNLGLKWEMSKHLRKDFTLQNPDLELLNFRFGAAALGVKLWSYSETQDTNLEVLSTGDTTGETLTTLDLCIVDSRSAKMSTPDVPIEEEEVKELHSTHVGAPRFTDDDSLRDRYVQDIISFIQTFSSQERAAHRALTLSIMNDIRVDVHQFYQTGSAEEPAMKIWSEHPTLQTFLDVGPAECLKRRLRTPAQVKQPMPNGISKPSIEIRHPTESPAPRIVVGKLKGSTEQSPTRNMTDSLSPPIVEQPRSIHTHIPSVTHDGSSLGSSGYLMPGKSITKPSTEGPPQRSHVYQLPSTSRDRFRWVHVPYTHTGWVPHILTTISQEKANLNLHQKLLLDQIWISQHNRATHASPHARFVRSSCKSLLPRDSPHHHRTDGLKLPFSAIDEAQLVLYLPYLHWDSFKHLKMRAAVVKKRRKQPLARPVDKEISNGDSIESKLIWQYLTSDRPIHCRRTLDQYGYPSLRNTSVRDADQVLYKRTRVNQESKSSREPPLKHIRGIWRAVRPSGLQQAEVEEGDDAAKVLMVDQLWLWILDDQTVITFAAPKEDEDDGISKQGDLRNNIYQDINGDLARQCEDCFDFAALAVFHAVNALLGHTTDISLHVFSVFEEYISVLTEQQTKSFKEFRENHKTRDPKDIDTHRLPRYVDNRADLDALLELRDIEDELNTIDKLLKEQHRTVVEMLQQYEELNRLNRGLNGISILHEAKHTIDEYKEQIDAMLKSAQAAQKAFQVLLDMKQKQANIVEAHLAREQTEVAADQSRSVMIFTIFTIIFLPLSFFASVFGINAREWSGVSTNPDFHTVFVYMGAISLGVIVIALLVAFNKATRRVSRTVWKVSAKPITDWWRRRARNGTKGDGEGEERVPLVEVRRDGGKRLSTVSMHERGLWDEEFGLKGFE